MQLYARSVTPMTSMGDATKKALEILTKNPYPEYITRNYFFTFGPDGIVMNVLFDVEKGKEEEGLENIMQRMAELGSAAPGIAGILEPVFSFEQVFAWWGK